MQKFKCYLLLMLLNFVLLFFSGCKQEQVDPKIEADLKETEFILKSYLEQPEEFEVYIYMPFTTNPDKYLLKTTNRHIYFENHTLIVNPDKQRFLVDKFKLARSEQPAGKNSPDEPNKIKRFEIYFNAH